MIVIEQLDGWHCRSRIICHTCEKPITEGDNAMAISRKAADGEDDVLLEVLYCHKKPHCQFRTLAAAGHKVPTDWEDVSTHLAALGESVGLTPDLYRERYARIHGHREAEKQLQE